MRGCRRCTDDDGVSPKILVYGNMPDPVTWLGLALVLAAILTIGARRLCNNRYSILYYHHCTV